MLTTASEAIADQSPVMLDFRMYRVCSCCQAVGLPHAAGKVPIRLLLPRYRPCSNAKEPLLPQAAGRVL